MGGSGGTKRYSDLSFYFSNLGWGCDRLASVRKAWECLRCGHKWLSFKDSAPRACAGCSSAYWDRPRRNRKAKKNEVAKEKGYPFSGEASAVDRLLKARAALPGPEERA